MSPFENRVVSFEMTGKEVKMMLKEIQGGRYSFYPTSGLKLVVSKKPKKSLISAKLYDGVYERDIIENQVYVVGTVDFNLPFGGDDFRAVKKWYEVRNLKTFGILRDEITDYLKNINIVKHNNFYRYDKPRLKIIERTRFDLFDKEFYDNDNEQGDNDDNIIMHNDIHYNKHFKKHYKYNKKNNKT
jgi:2',3'-cyclic-nucleotide 2'-phosphodiesterase (5'-nucleotidase family)